MLLTLYNQDGSVLATGVEASFKEGIITIAGTRVRDCITTQSRFIELWSDSTSTMYRISDLDYFLLINGIEDE